MKTLLKRIKPFPVTETQPKREEVLGKDQLLKINWEIEDVVDPLCKDFFKKQVYKVPELHQRLLIIKEPKYYPCLNDKSIIFYTSDSTAKNDLNLIKRVVDATNEDIDDFNKRINELNIAEAEDKAKKEQAMKKLFE